MKTSVLSYLHFYNSFLSDKRKSANKFLEKSSRKWNYLVFARSDIMRENRLIPHTVPYRDSTIPYRQSLLPTQSDKQRKNSSKNVRFLRFFFRLRVFNAFLRVFFVFFLGLKGVVSLVKLRTLFSYFFLFHLNMCSLEQGMSTSSDVYSGSMNMAVLTFGNWLSAIAKSHVTMYSH
jgi:hypothetical protein